MRWPVKILAICLIAMLCSGCMGSQEIDQLSFVLTIGVDKANEPGLYDFTYRVALPISFIGEGGSDKEKTKLVTVKAQNLTEAMRQLAVAMNRQPEFSHLSAFFVNEEVAREGIYDFVSFFLRGQAYRNTMIPLVIKSKAREAMEKNTAPFELFQYRWADSLKRTNQLSGTYIVNDLHTFDVYTKEPAASVLTGYATTIEDSLEKEAEKPLEKHVMRQFDVDDFPRKGGTELIVVGSTIFRDWKMVGSLTCSESMGAAILKRDVQTIFSVKDPLHPDKSVSVGVRIRKPQIDVDVKNNQMQITIKTKVHSDLLEVATGVNYAEGQGRKVLEQQVNEAIRESIQAYFDVTQPLGADCTRISSHYRKNVAAWQEWEQMDWPALYQNAKVKIEVDTEVNRSGLLWRVLNKGEKSNV